VSIASLDLNLLVTLDAVLHERSVAQAARRLHVTPSAVSNALARLRSVLGDPLVTRSGRGIVPTPHALALAPALARALRELERAVLPASFDPALCTATFTLALADAGQVAWLPAISVALRRKLPRARLRVVGIASLLSLGDLASQEVDLHVGVAASGPGIHVQPLLEEKTVLVARTGHASVRAQRDLSALGHVAVEMAPGRGIRDRLAEVWAQAGIERNVVITVPSFAAAAAVVAESELVTTLPRSVAYAQRARLAMVRGPVPTHVVPLAMCWHERTHGDPAMKLFRSLVEQAIRSVKKRPATRAG
jgi:DNA-binding transcriptional LysR family regulator